MKQKNYKRKTTVITCDYCGKEFEKTVSEINRNAKFNRKNYCCRECCAKGANLTKKNNGYREPTKKMLEHLSKIKDNRIDELTPFRYTFRVVRNRCQEINIDLEYLKEVWDNQNGICPFTGIKLILPTNSNLKKIDIFHRASLDRIDSSKGYNKGNVQFVSTSINYMKNNSSDYEVKKFLKEISDYTKKLVI